MLLIECSVVGIVEGKELTAFPRNEIYFFRIFFLLNPTALGKEEGLLPSFSKSRDGDRSID